MLFSIFAVKFIMFYIMDSLKYIFLVFLYIIASYRGNAESPYIISTTESDISFHIDGKDLAYNPSIVKPVYDENGISTLLEADIDNDGKTERIYAYNNFSGLIIEMYKNDTSESHSVGDTYEINFTDQDFQTENGGISLTLHDFDKDKIPELVITYQDGIDIKGRVYKLNGSSRNINLKDVLGLRNWFEPAGEFIQYSSGQAQIDGEAIITQGSPRGGVFVTYIYRNGKLWRLAEE